MEYIFSIVMGVLLGLLFWQFIKGGKSDLIGGIIIALLGTWLGGFVVIHLGLSSGKLAWGAAITTITAFVLFVVMQVIAKTNNKKKNKSHMDKEAIEDNWPAIKDKIKLRFGKISDEGMESVRENFELLTKVLQETYGYAKEQAEKEFKSFKESLSVE